MFDQFRLAHAIALAAAAAAPCTAFAQSAENAPAPAKGAAATPGDAAAGDVIIVTAQRRETSLARTAVAINVVNGEALQRQAITSEKDLQFVAPGLIVKAGWSSNQLNFAIRGQTIDAFTASQPAVLPYLNEIPVGTLSASTLYDLDSVQVLKGPQGTLFGRNVTGGAVLYTSATPKSQLGGYITGRLGDYALRQVEGALNVPLAGHAAILRVAGSLERRDGFTKNLFNGTYLGDIDRKSVRATLLLRPVDGLENQLVVAYNKTGGTPTPGILWSAYADSLFIPANFNALAGGADIWSLYLAAHPKVDPNGILSYLQTQKARGPFVTNLDAPTFTRAHDWFVSNVTTLDVGPDTKVKNVFGYLKQRARFA